MESVLSCERNVGPVMKPLCCGKRLFVRRQPSYKTPKQMKLTQSKHEDQNIKPENPRSHRQDGTEGVNSWEESHTQRSDKEQLKTKCFKS